MIEEAKPRVELSVAEHEARFRLLVEAVSDYAIYMLDPRGCITTWNAGAERITGYRAEEVLGKSFVMFFLPEDAAAGRHLRELEMAKESGRFEEERIRRRKDGSQFWANVVLTPIADEAGRHVGFAKVTRDLTERLEAQRVAQALLREQATRAAAEAAEARLRESEDRYRNLSHRLSVILESVADGISVQEPSGRVVFANVAAARTCGFDSVEGLLNAGPEEVLDRFSIRDEHGEIVVHDQLPGRRVLRGEPPCSTTIHVEDRRTGAQWWSRVRATAVHGPQGEVELAVNVWHDITEDRRRARHEQFLAQATQALSESLDYESRLATLAARPVPQLADSCMIHLLERGGLSLVAVAHAQAEQSSLIRELERRYPPQDDGTGVWNVLRTRTTELSQDITDVTLRAWARDAEHLSLLRQLGMTKVLRVPVWAHGRVLGVMSLGRSSEGGFGSDEVLLLEELGRRAGSGIENARLYAAERRIRDRLLLLAESGKTFAQTLDYDELLRMIPRVALPTLGDFAVLEMLSAQGTVRVAYAHDSPRANDLLASEEPLDTWQRRERIRQTTESSLTPFVDEATLHALDEDEPRRVLLRKLATSSLLVIPVRGCGPITGRLTLGFATSRRHHDEDDLRIAEELARRAGAALAQAHLYAEAREAARRGAEAAERAEAANRVKDEFLATVSHELRTPLNAILGWACLLQERNSDPANEKGLDVVVRNARAQATLIEDILDVSRIITGKLRLDLQLTSLRAIVEEAVEVIRPSAMAKRISIELSLPDDECSLVADPVRLQQVVWNVLSNAVKFSEPRGRIEAALWIEGSAIHISVKDSGIGIEPEFLSRVFDRFQQVDSSSRRRQGGLGLGLAIVRHLVELHGGEVRAMSEGLGHGATFSMVFPRGIRVSAVEPGDAFALGHASSSAARPPPDSALFGLRILVVDDEADARDLLEAMLSHAGASVETAANAREALQAFARERPDALVSDIGMPHEDGYSLMKRVRALEGPTRRAVPALALTAYVRAQDRKKAIEAGFSKHLGKPVNPRELIDEVAKLVTTARPTLEEAP